MSWIWTVVLFSAIVLLGCGDGENANDARREPTAIGEHDDPGPPVEDVFEPWTVTVSCAGDGCLVTWQGSGQNIPRFEVYRREIKDSSWSSLAQIAVGKASKGDFTYVDAAAKPGFSYCYGVSAVNCFQRESEIVETAPITVP